MRKADELERKKKLTSELRDEGGRRAKETSELRDEGDERPVS